MRKLEYKNYLLGMLMVATAATYVERSVFGLALQDIKVELALTDTQLGFLTGIAFALFYALVGVPIARWADRGNRVTIISLGAAVGSVMVMLCGAATNFVMLMLIRIGVAVGESSSIPTSNSLIADHFTRAERPRAIAIFFLGGPLAVIIGFVVGGWLIELYGWRTAFAVIGAPALGVGLLAWLTLKEPRLAGRTGATGQGIVENAEGAASGQAPARHGFKEACVLLWNIPTFRHILGTIVLIQMLYAGIYKWMPAFFRRSYEMQTGELGLWLAVTIGCGALLGTYLGGELASRLAPQDERRQMKSMALLCCVLAIPAIGIYVTRSQYVAFALIALTQVGTGLLVGPKYAVIQTLVPSDMRAMSLAVLNLIGSLVGAGLGPLAVGALSDGFRSWAGEESLRYALMATSPFYLLVAWHFYRAAMNVNRDLESTAVRSTA